ncbi:MAG: membrane protein insertase YidC, partial [Candidatus Pacebacteria bacterium]|nr:membrane protein insertase YidC [Candidatus Paceibacterota bacterium]
MNRRTIIAMAFCLAVFLAWGPLMRRLGWVAPPNDAEAPRDQAEEQAETVPDASAPPEEAEDQEDEEQPTSLTPESPPTITSTPSKPPAAEGAVRPSQPRSVRPRETAYLTVPDILQASVDLQRGGISQVRLMKYLAYDREQLVSLGSYRFPYCVLTVAGDEWSLGNNAEIVRRDESTLIIRRRGEHRAVLCEEQWSVDSADSYRVRYSVTLVNDGSEALTFRNLAVAMGGLTAASGGSSPKLARVGRVDLGVELSTDLDKRPQSYSAKDVATLGAEQREEMSHQETQWAAVHNKYFMFYLAAESAPFSGCQLTTTEITDATEDASDEWLWGVGFLPPTTLAPGERRTLEFSGYVGPKEYKRLRALGRGVESVMRLDLFMFWRTSWMGVISMTILRSLIWLRGVIGHPWG